MPRRTYSPCTLPVNFDFESYAIHRRVNIYDWADSDVPDELDDLGYTISMKFGDKADLGYVMFPQDQRDAYFYSSDLKLKETIENLDNEDQPIGTMFVSIIENARDILGLDSSEEVPEIIVKATYPLAAAWKMEGGSEEAPSFSVSLPNNLSDKKKARRLVNLAEQLQFFENLSEEFSARIFNITPDVADDVLAAGQVHRYDRAFQKKIKSFEL